MYDVIVCGSGVIDVFVKTHADSVIKNGTKEIAYPLGSKIIINRKDVQIGGGGTNCATCFSRLGLKTGYIGCLGNDNDSKTITDFLNKENIRFLGHKTNDHQTGYSVVLDSQNEDRTILTYKGANNYLSFDKIKLPKTKWIYSSSLVEKSYIALKKIALHAKKNKIKFAFNPSSYQAKLGVEKLKQILKCTDLLIFNKEEAQLLTKSKRQVEGLSTLILPNLKENATLIITDGKKGAFLFSKNSKLKLEPAKCKIVETTGAGDAFASTYLALRIIGHDNKESLLGSVENAQSVIKNYGAKEILLPYTKLKNKIKTSKSIIR